VSRWIPVKNFVSNPTSRTRVYDTPPPPPLCHWRTGHGAQGTSTLRERETSLRTLRTLRERETSLRTRGLSSVTANACNKLWCIGCVVATAQHRIPVLIRLHLHLRICPYFIPYPSLSLSLSLSLSRRRPYFLPAPCSIAKRHGAPHGLRKTRRGHAATYTSHKTVVTRMCQLLGIIGHTHKHTGGKAPQRV